MDIKESTKFRTQFTALADACTLAEAIVDTVREPILLLDQDLRVIAASRSFYAAFDVKTEDTQGRFVYALGDGQWDIPKLRVLLEQIIPAKQEISDYEVEHTFPTLGHRTMSLNARQVRYEESAATTILLAIEDITQRRVAEREMKALLRQKEILLEELEHRIANSLQIIASIILMKARTVDSEETRLHLQDAHKRVVSVAAIQKQLHSSAGLGRVEMAPYLSKLCDTLSNSVIGEDSPILLRVTCPPASANPRDAESLGLIATELVMNAVKHAFPLQKDNSTIDLGYEVNGTNWKFSVSDNGIGRPDGVFAQPRVGLGTGIVKALAQQMDAVLDTTASALGTTVTVTHATFSKLEASLN